MHEIFRKAAHWSSEKLGSPWGFGIALSLIVIWALSGPLLGFSTTWQLIINTATTVLTFLMVFLIQNTHNRDDLALLQEEFKKFRDAKIAEIKIKRKR